MKKVEYNILMDEIKKLQSLMVCQEDELMVSQFRAFVVGFGTATVED